MAALALSGHDIPAFLMARPENNACDWKRLALGVFRIDYGYSHGSLYSVHQTSCKSDRKLETSCSRPTTRMKEATFRVHTCSILPDNEFVDGLVNERDSVLSHVIIEESMSRELFICTLTRAFQSYQLLHNQLLLVYPTRSIYDPPSSIFLFEIPCCCLKTNQ
jgi:hypothetical protein